MDETREDSVKYALLEFACDDVREYLEFAVAMRAKAGVRIDAVLVQHAQAAKLVVSVIVIPEIERVRIGIDI